MINKLSKYRFLLDDEFAYKFREPVIKWFIEIWVNKSGVKKVSSGVIRCDIDQEAGTMLYSAHFDSSHWTGIGFEGFDKKHPGEPVTIF